MIGRQITHYRLTDHVKDGGMGMVYKAQDLTLKRTVAVKVVKGSRQDDRIAARRFLREARAVSQIHHPNVITLYDIVQQDDASFLIMEYIAGPSLRDRIDKAPIDAAEAVRITCEVTSALAAAHDLGVVHRDIKPENVMIDTTGLAKVLDFGVAHLVDRTTLTRAGRIVGTLPYMGPEQIKGEDVDARADIYAVGVLLFEMITGKLPFEAHKEEALFYQILNVDAPRLSSLVPILPAGLEAVVAKALAKDPGERYETAQDMLHDLDVVMVGIRETTRPSGERLYAKPVRRRRIVRWTLVAALVFVAFGLSQTFGPDWMSVRRWVGAQGGGLGGTGLPSDKKLLVLPFTNVGEDPSIQVLSEGIMETLSAMLTQMEQFEGSLWVVPARAVQQAGLNSVDDARRAFGVNLVIVGSVQRLGGIMRVTMNLVDAHSERQLRSSVIDASPTSFAALQTRTVEQVAEILELGLPESARDVLSAGGTGVPSAYEFYLQGRGYLQRYQSMESLDNAVHSFELAVDQDTTYALAYAGWGEALWLKHETSPNLAWVEEARSHCRHALRLSDRLAAVRVTLGIIQAGTGHYDDAVTEFTRALDIDPQNYSAMVELAEVHSKTQNPDAAEDAYRQAISFRPTYWGGYNKLGAFYWRHGRLPEATEMFERATEFAPDNVRAYNNLIALHYLQGDMEKAEAVFERSISIEPNADAYSNMGVILIYENKYAEAVPILQWAIRLGVDNYYIWGNLGDACRYTPEFADKASEAYQNAIELLQRELTVNPKDADVRSSLAVYYAKSGQHDSAEREIAEVTALAPDDPNVWLQSGIAHQIGGRSQSALEAIEQAIQLGVSKKLIIEEPELASLKQDERFQELIGE